MRQRERERTEKGAEETLFFALAAAFSFPGRVFLGVLPYPLESAGEFLRPGVAIHTYLLFFFSLSTLFLNPCN